MCESRNGVDFNPAISGSPFHIIILTKVHIQTTEWGSLIVRNALLYFSEEMKSKIMANSRRIADLSFLMVECHIRSTLKSTFWKISAYINLCRVLGYCLCQL